MPLGLGWHIVCSRSHGWPFSHTVVSPSKSTVPWFLACSTAKTLVGIPKAAATATIVVTNTTLLAHVLEFEIFAHFTESSITQ